jgi:hypothetical protein
LAGSEKQFQAVNGMHKRLEVGTDIAMIGIWDVAHARPDLKQLLGSASFDPEIRSDAIQGRLFLVYPGGDGSWDIEVFVSEEPPQELLEVYSQLNRKFRIESTSGQMIAEGIEDFVKIEDFSPTEANKIPVPPGSYSLAVHELQDHLLDSEYILTKLLGAEDYQYYTSHAGTSEWFGCLTILVVVASIAVQGLLGTFDYWFVPVGAIAIWAIYHFVQRSRTDERFASLSKRVREYVESKPAFIFVLTPIADAAGLEGGYYEL